MFWIGIVVGIVTMQLFTYLLAYITDENLDIVVPFSVFIFYLLMMPISKLAIVIKRKFKEKRRANGNK